MQQLRDYQVEAVEPIIAATYRGSGGAASALSSQGSLPPSSWGPMACGLLGYGCVVARAWAMFDHRQRAFARPAEPSAGVVPDK
jgi:hypothetical protein